MIHGRAKSGNVELAYSVEGDGPETILLVMGLGGRAADWGFRFSSQLSTKYRVVRFDNRGTGSSTVTPGGFSLEDMARDTTAVLDAVQAERAHVIGISMGGMIAQLISLDHADRVDRLVLVCTHSGGPAVVPPRAEALRLFDPGEFIARGRSPAEMMRFTMSVISAPGYVERDPEGIGALVGYALAAPTRPAAFMGQLQAILQSDRSERLGDIRHPTLVVHGREDSLIPVENGMFLAERIPGAQLEVLEGCGHMPMWERPDELAAA